MLKQNPAVVTEFFKSLLDEIAQTPETFLNNTFNEYGFGKVAAALRACSPPDEQGSHYKYNSIDFYNSHTDAVGVFSRLQSEVNHEQVKQRRKEKRDSEFINLITTIEKASEVIAKILNRSMDKVISPHPTSTDGTTLNMEIAILVKLAHTFLLGASIWADDSTQAEIFNVTRGKISAANPNNILNSYKIFIKALPTFVQYLKDKNDQNPQSGLSSFFQELPDEYRDLMQ